MEVSRRLILKSTLVIAALGSVGTFVRRSLWPRLQPGPIAPTQHDTLAVLLDTLIPDDDSPGATETGVAQAIRDKTEQNSRYRKLIESGCAWLDIQANDKAGIPFAELHEDQREAIVDLAASGRGGRGAFLFFQTMRTDAFHYYYAQPEAWAALRYAGPPQPHGFMDYTHPPR